VETPKVDEAAKSLSKSGTIEQKKDSVNNPESAEKEKSSTAKDISDNTVESGSAPSDKASGQVEEKE